MSTFSEANFIKKLLDLNSSQQSIQTLSLWLIHHRKNAKAVVDVWFKELLQAKTPKKLTFIYLANDVIQNAKKKGPEFTRAFVAVLPQVFEHTASSADEKILQSLDRLLKIWSERGVFEDATMAKLMAAIAKPRAGLPDKEASRGAVREGPEAKKRRPAAQKESAVTAQNAVQTQKQQTSESPAQTQQQVSYTPPPTLRDLPLEAADLAKLIMDLENSASSDAEVRKRIAALPPEVTDMSRVDKIRDATEAGKLSAIVDEACILLADYNRRLSLEMEDRKRLAGSLTSFVELQKEQLAESEKKLEEFKLRLDKVTSVRQELKNHIQNLPDFTLLPDPRAGLPPLPSAGDLFSL